jgi:hypothetical protein
MEYSIISIQQNQFGNINLENQIISIRSESNKGDSNQVETNIKSSVAESGADQKENFVSI